MKPEVYGDTIFGTMLHQVERKGFMCTATFDSLLNNRYSHVVLRIRQNRAGIVWEGKSAGMPVHVWNMATVSNIENMYDLLIQRAEEAMAEQESAPILLCKCMRDQCMNTHWSDLTDEQKAKFPKTLDKEDKTWPPRGMETK